ncbi:hypothetical protein AX16_001342 [Volvariella volvacea WC 439]|nr:hypothetical protein AX16_001342 [Volvariella volvacea WC 439]
MSQRSSITLGDTDQQLPQIVDLRAEEKVWADGGTIGLYSDGFLFQIYRRFLQENIPSFVEKYQLTEVPPPRPSIISTDGNGSSSKNDKKKKWRLGKDDKSTGSKSRLSRVMGGWGNGGHEGEGIAGAAASETSLARSDAIDEESASKGIPIEIAGMPVYLVEDETPQDLQNFLWALVKPSTFSQKVNYDVLFAVLELGTKYDAAALRKAAIQHIMSTYPATLERFLNREDTRTLPPAPGALFALLSKDAHYRRQAKQAQEPYQQKYPYLIPPVLLPTLLYCCTTHTMEELVDGVDYEGQKVRLGSEDLRRCLLALPRLVEKKDKIYDFLRQDYVNGCYRLRRRRNNSALGNIEYYKDNPCALGRMESICIRPLYDMDIFDDDDEWWEEFERGVCEACHQAADDAFSEARLETWKELPSIFLFESSWETLSRMSEADGEPIVGEAMEVKD